jgi:hypothetical protein
MRSRLGVDCERNRRDEEQMTLDLRTVFDFSTLSLALSALVSLKEWVREMCLFALQLVFYWF